MLYTLVSFLAVVPSPTLGKTAAQLCRGTATLADDGNWYCSQVQAITYKNISQPGEYNRTTRVDPKTGLCDHEPVAYAGAEPATPLIGELSMHLRGPMNVSQMAVYKLPDTGILNGGDKVAKRSEQQKRRDTDVKVPGAVDPARPDLIDHHSATISRASKHQDRGLHSLLGFMCTFTPTITTTIHVRGSTCGLTSAASTYSSTCDNDEDGDSGLLQPTAQPLPPPPPPSIDVSTAPPVAIPPPPPPVVAPSPPPAPLAVTTTIHDTITVCPLGALASSALPWSVLNSHCNSMSHAPSCPCLSIATTATLIVPSASSTPSPQIPTSTSKSGYLHTMDQLGRRGEFELAGPPSPRSDKVNKAAATTWSRVAYYTSTTPAAATGFAFLANLGDPQKSGTFDYSFGNSLGYVIGDGSKVTTDSTPFDGTLETSEIEVAVFTDKACDGDCEYVRPNSTAHYGWDGPSKAFFIEFQMDHQDNAGSDQGMLSDAPAWWFLNAAIPRILQYGNDRNNIPCSCWSTGCGEFDAFEILGRGEVRAKSTIHRQGNLEGGDSNYFLRPVGKTIKFVVVFHRWNITARVLDDGFDFSQHLTQKQIEEILAYDGSDATHSLFSVGD